MVEDARAKPYDLEERTLRFAKRVVALVDKLPRTITTIEIGKQLVRSAGSVGANYIEANEALSKKDFQMRIKICRKEAKESCYWLRLLTCEGDQDGERESLLKESTEIMKIFGSIVEKTNSRKNSP
jgi:four helix bundle protein